MVYTEVFTGLCAITTSNCLHSFSVSSLNCNVHDYLPASIKPYQKIQLFVIYFITFVMLSLFSTEGYLTDRLRHGLLQSICKLHRLNLINLALLSSHTSSLIAETVTKRTSTVDSQCGEVGGARPGLCPRSTHCMVMNLTLL